MNSAKPFLKIKRVVSTNGLSITMHFDCLHIVTALMDESFRFLLSGSNSDQWQGMTSLERVLNSVPYTSGTNGIEKFIKPELIDAVDLIHRGNRTFTANSHLDVNEVMYVAYYSWRHDK